MEEADRQARVATTEILLRAKDEGESALEALTPIVYDELRRLAASYLRRERDDHTLQPTALANEAFMRLVDSKSVDPTSRAHFLGVAARTMRQVLVDHARTKGAQKRGGGWARKPLTEAVAEFRAPDADVIALDDALEELAALNERQARVVEMRFFGGMTMPEIAAALSIGQTTAEDAWYMARAWLRRRLGSAD